jgi:hypothetical protein
MAYRHHQHHHMAVEAMAAQHQHMGVEVTMLHQRHPMEAVATTHQAPAVVAILLQLFLLLTLTISLLAPASE